MVGRHCGIERESQVLQGFAKFSGGTQVEPFAYLRDVLAPPRPGQPANTSEADDLLPGVWLQTHPEARRCWSR